MWLYPTLLPSAISNKSTSPIITETLQNIYPLLQEAKPLLHISVMSNGLSKGSRADAIQFQMC